MSEKLPISVSIIACDEEARIKECLGSLKDFDDIVVVVDSRTTDNTARIAEDFGCRVFIEDWKGFGPQKQSAIEKCRNDFLLVLDADERLSAGSVEAIRGVLKDGKADAYSLKRRSYIGNRQVKYSGWWPDRVVRLFDRRKCRIEGMVHEKVKVAGKTASLDAVIEHRSFTGYSHMIEKMNRYSSDAADELYRRNKRVTLLAPVTHAAWMLFRTLILKKGFMDGLDGLVISVLTASGSFFKYAKLLWIQKRR